MALPTPTVAPVAAGKIPQGSVSYLFVTTVANPAAPTAAELTAGTDYKNQIASVQGFAPQGSTLDMPNAGSRQIPNVPATFSLGDGTIVFNLNKSGTGDARSVFNDGTDGTSTQTSGYWYICYEGLTTGGTMRGFTATCTSSVPTTDIAAAFQLTTMWALQGATGIIPVPSA